jgi:hypothetical protein
LRRADPPSKESLDYKTELKQSVSRMFSATKWGEQKREIRDNEISHWIGDFVVFKRKSTSPFRNLFTKNWLSQLNYLSYSMGFDFKFRPEERLSS